MALLLFTFLLGVCNFAVHKAMLESHHPVLAQLPFTGGPASLVVEFGMLVAALLLALTGAGWAAAVYFAFSALNALSAWLILTGRI